MDRISYLKIEDTIHMSNCTVLIGNIDDANAIYTIPHPAISPDVLKDSIVDDDGNCTIPVTFTTRLIYPASEEHIRKYKRRYKYVTESVEEYYKNENFLKTSWLDNIIKDKAMNEKIYFENEECMIIADYKWDKTTMDKMYLLMIFKDDSLKSIRSIKDVELLKRAKNNIYSICKDLGADTRKIALFFHYRPSYFRLHIHIVNISVSIDSMGTFSRVVFVDDVIKNLSIDPEYYQKECHIIELDTSNK